MVWRVGRWIGGIGKGDFVAVGVFGHLAWVNYTVRVIAEQAKKSAQQQAIDKRRQEQARKMEQQRIANAASDVVSAVHLDVQIFC